MVLFSSVTAFVEQVGRQKSWEKRDTLDTLTRIYTGPTALLDKFTPVNGARDAQYSLMTVLSAKSKDLGQGIGVSELTVNYHGKLANGTAYMSVPTISTSWSEGEVGWTSAVMGGESQPGFTISSGTVKWTHRYTGRNVVLAYITNYRPSGNPTLAGTAKGYMGFTNEADYLVSFSSSIEATAAYAPNMLCSDLRIEDVADGWFKVTETYQSRYLPASISIPQNKIYYSTTMADVPLGGGGTVTREHIDFVKNPAAPAANQAQGGWQAANPDTPSGSSPPGSVGADTAAVTGIDPASQAESQLIAAGMAGVGGPGAALASIGYISPDVSDSSSSIGDTIWQTAGGPT
jgi:hypothetical protein